MNLNEERYSKITWMKQGRLAIRLHYARNPLDSLKFCAKTSQNSYKRITQLTTLGSEKGSQLGTSISSV